MKQAIIKFKDDNPSPFEGGGRLVIDLDASEEAPVFIIDGIFHIKGNDKKTYYAPVCNVLSVVVS